MSDKITFVCVTQNRLKNLQRMVPRIINYVDRMVFVDGFSVDGTKAWLEAYSPKIFVAQRKWDDSFANQYNEYLKHIGEGWVLICDDDELPSDALLKSLRKLVDDSKDGTAYSCVEFNCNPIDTDKNGNILLDHGPSGYYRRLFFRYEPGMRYVVDLHQNLVGYKNGKTTKKADVYYHIKSAEDEYRNACRNWWIAGMWLENATKGVFPPEWCELRDLVLRLYPEVRVFSDFNAIMVKGNIDPLIKEFFYKIKDLKDDPPRTLYNELRIYWPYYFKILHPEENVTIEKKEEKAKMGRVFSEDWFSGNIRFLTKHLAEFRGKENIKFLEIGSYEGLSTCWFMDNILTHPSSKIHCIDLWEGSGGMGAWAKEIYASYNMSTVLKNFMDNTREYGDRVTHEIGVSQVLLRALPINEGSLYDLVYVDGSHIASDVLEDSILAFRLLKPGGIMIFDDYKWDPFKDPRREPRMAVDAFLEIYKGRYELLHSDYQVFIRKIKQELHVD